MKQYLLLLIPVFLMVISCQDPEPRRPVSARTGSFIKESIDRNKKLLEAEEARIKTLIAADSLHHYQRSANGYWYTLEQPDSTTNYYPKENDLVKIAYEIRNLDSTLIYSKESIGEIEFKVDKEALFPGLRTGVKLLREGETALFYFPSAMAYGYHGDEDKIQTNTPLMTWVTLLEVTEKASDSIIQE
ncbi:gliding motility-associated peptidyl-prolyl isomerase GldI [Robertkochia marina]|uniref:Peptidyl-prolyl cis-trans isomerase n=1 Tax=Robertkochia marina TaxID=1227945 RepID=A0A4S3M0U5_9FLAO|nr:gliding motility-associated peptidyl-prolyl isomerase GldI [Robertkochia marina]THD66573.1 gliding motility-associated peptidyl-prolyl isomerase GldI [Robertkochia marina]TRZ45588.1 gliding motility-associated peptidyl-prolyl isomerase GldI [Robertkochia marina]